LLLLLLLLLLGRGEEGLGRLGAKGTLERAVRDIALGRRGKGARGGLCDALEELIEGGKDDVTVRTTADGWTVCPCARTLRHGLSDGRERRGRGR